MKPIKKMLLYLLAFGLIGTAQAEMIAFANNNAGGKIVFTDEICKRGNKTFEPLRRSYMYTSTGQTMEGCYGIEDDTLLTVWEDGEKNRYPLSAITVVKRKGQNL